MGYIEFIFMDYLMVEIIGVRYCLEILFRKEEKGQSMKF